MLLYYRNIVATGRRIRCRSCILRNDDHITGVPGARVRLFRGAHVYAVIGAVWKLCYRDWRPKGSTTASCPAACAAKTACSRCARGVTHYTPGRPNANPRAGSDRRTHELSTLCYAVGSSSVHKTSTPVERTTTSKYYSAIAVYCYCFLLLVVLHYNVPSTVLYDEHAANKSRKVAYLAHV